MATDTIMRELSAVQHGVVGRAQLGDRGVGDAAIRRRLRAGDWEAITHRVVRLAGSPRTDEQRAMAATLDAGDGSVLSHLSAAALWGLPGFSLRSLEVSRSRVEFHRSTTLAVVHHPRYLPAHHRTVHRSVPVTTLARTVFDVAGAVREERAERVLQAAMRSGLTWRVVEDHMEELAARGRPGIEHMRSLLATHRGRPILGSGLEARFLRLLCSAGLPEPRRQVEVGARAWAGRVDFLYDDVRLVIEVNGTWSHSSPLDVARDQRRTAALVAAGFTVLPISEDLVRRHPEEAVRLVRAALASGRGIPLPAAGISRPEARAGGQLQRRAATTL